MNILLIILLAAVPFLIGSLYGRLTGSAKMGLAETFSAGSIVTLALAGAAAMPAVKLKLPYSSYRNTAVLLLGAFALVGIVPAGKRLVAAAREKNSGRTPEPGLFVLAAALFVLSVSVFFTSEPDTQRDMTAETIFDAVETDTMFVYHPGTGEELELGVYPMDKLRVLPLIYGIGYEAGGMNMRDYLYRLLPVWVLLLNYTVIGKWAGFLFEGQEEAGAKKKLLFVFYGLLNLFGDYLFITYSYKLLHEAWTGETLLITVVLPYLGCLVAELLTDRAAVVKNLPLAVCCLLTAIFAAPVKEAAVLCVITLAAAAIPAAVRRVRYAGGH